MSQPRLDKARLFDSLRYRPHPAQLVVHRSRTQRRILSCGSRFGKTTVAVYEAVAALLEPRESTIGWTVGPTLDISDRVFKRVGEIMTTNFKHRVQEYSEREHRIVVRNFSGGRSELRGKTADRRDSLLGEGLDFVIVDEAAKLDEEIWSRHLSQRLLDKKGWALLISTPEGRNHFWREFKRGQKGRDAAYQSWSFPSWANPALDRELIEQERSRLTPDTFRQEYGGEFVGEDFDPCDICGGPSDACGSYVLRSPGKPLLYCPTCKLQVDEDGRTVVGRHTDGTPVAMTSYDVGPDPCGDPAKPAFGSPRITTVAARGDAATGGDPQEPAS